MDGITSMNKPIVTNVHQDVPPVLKPKSVKLVTLPESTHLQNVHVKMEKLKSPDPVYLVITDVLNVKLLLITVLNVKILTIDQKLQIVNVKMNSMMMVINIYVTIVNQNVLNVLVLLDVLNVKLSGFIFTFTIWSFWSIVRIFTFSTVISRNITFSTSVITRYTGSGD
jgi:hypothetical protein